MLPVTPESKRGGLCYDARVDPQPEALLDLLDLDCREAGLFRAAPPRAWLPRVFGGQLLAQALWAASRTLDGPVCHSLHATFLRGAEAGYPIDYRVTLIREGRTVVVCQVTAAQREETKLVLIASFERADVTGPAHQDVMPETPEPETFGQEEARVARMLASAPIEYHAAIRRRWPFEWITVDEYYPHDGKPGPTCVRTWMRGREKLTADANLQRCALAYASDMLILDPSMNAVAADFADPNLLAASLDHAMWFHRSHPADDWLLFVCDSPSVASGRGFNRGAIYDRQGRLLASVAQEAVLRKRAPAGA